MEFNEEVKGSFSALIISLRVRRSHCPQLLPLGWKEVILYTCNSVPENSRRGKTGYGCYIVTHPGQTGSGGVEVGGAGWGGVSNPSHHTGGAEQHSCFLITSTNTCTRLLPPTDAHGRCPPPTHDVIPPVWPQGISSNLTTLCLGTLMPSWLQEVANIFTIHHHHNKHLLARPLRLTSSP